MNSNSTYFNDKLIQWNSNEQKKKLNNKEF